VTRQKARPAMAGLSMLQQEVNELFQRLAILDRSDRLPGSEWSPAVDVLELRERLIVIVEVPGLALDSLKVAFRDRALVLTGDRRAPRVGQGARFHCLERPHGRFERIIPMDEPVDVAHASATLAGGLLTVTLPRLRERRGRETVIPIEREPTE
jgi:HSP20 family protein